MSFGPSEAAGSSRGNTAVCPAEQMLFRQFAVGEILSASLQDSQTYTPIKCMSVWHNMSKRLQAVVLPPLSRSAVSLFSMGLVQCGCCTPSTADEITEILEPNFAAPHADPLASAQTLLLALSGREEPELGAGQGTNRAERGAELAPRGESFATLIPDRASFRTLVPDRGSFSTLVPDRKSFDTLPSRASFGTLVPDRRSFPALPELEDDSELGELGSENEKPVLYADSLEAQAAVPKVAHRGFLSRFASIRRSSAPYRV